MATYAHVVNGVVENIVEWDGSSQYDLSNDLVPYADGCVIGATWDGSSFTPPTDDPAIEQESALRFAFRQYIAERIGYTIGFCTDCVFRFGEVVQRVQIGITHQTDSTCQTGRPQ